MKRLVIVLITALISVPVGGAIATTAGTDLARTGDYVVGETHDHPFGGTFVGVRTTKSHQPLMVIRNGDSLQRIPMDQITEIGR